MTAPDYYRGDSGVHYMLQAPLGPYAWSVNPDFSFSKVVDGSAMTILGEIPKGGCVTSAIWNGTQFFDQTPSYGRSTGFNLYIETAAFTGQQDWAPTEPGSQDDIPPYGGTTNRQLIGLNAAADGVRRRIQAAYFLRPSQIYAIIPAKNTRLVTDVVATVTAQIGFAGNDHIVRIDSEFVVPDDPIIQAGQPMSFIPFYFYCPNANGLGFNTQEWLNFTTGATRAYTAGQTSTTEVLMCRTDDSTRACACVYGSGVLGASGFYEGLFNAGATGYAVAFGFPVHDYPNGVPAGRVVLSSAWCFGTRADVITAIVTAYANLPAAVYP